MTLVLGEKDWDPVTMIHENPAAEAFIVVAVSGLPRQGGYWFFIPDAAVLAISRRMHAATLVQALAEAGGHS